MPRGDSTNAPALDDERGRRDGTILADRYRVIRRLGTGGMASVYLAEDTRLGREVAIKRLHSGRPDEDARRFAREARIGATLNHPNLVTVFDTVSDQDSVLIVMEYVGGTDLRSKLESGPLGDEEGMRILESLAEAIDHAHGHGIVHRDVKPANILIREDGQVKLADLGIARALEDTAITRSGVVLGTLLYLAPEVLTGEDAGPGADVYSMALIAFEVLTGTQARREGTVAQVAHRAINESPPDLRELRPDLPPAVAEVLRRALDPDPSRRPSSGASLVRDLRRALASSDDPAPVAVPPAPMTEEIDPAAPIPSAIGEGATATPTSGAMSYRRRGALLGIGGVLAVGAIIVFAVLALGGGSSDEPNRGQANGGAAKGSGAASSASPASPGGAVETFYERAAAGNYKGAWSLADSNFRSQLEGFSAFRDQQSTLRSIEFPSLEVADRSGSSATVSFTTVATHTGFVDRCNGSMGMVESDDRWLLDHAETIDCDRSPD